MMCTRQPCFCFHVLKMLSNAPPRPSLIDVSGCPACFAGSMLAFSGYYLDPPIVEFRPCHAHSCRHHQSKAVSGSIAPKNFVLMKRSENPGLPMSSCSLVWRT